MFRCDRLPLRCIPIKHCHAEDGLALTQQKFSDRKLLLTTYCNRRRREKYQCQNCNGLHARAIPSTLLRNSCRALGNLDIQLIISSALLCNLPRAFRNLYAKLVVSLRNDAENLCNSEMLGRWVTPDLDVHNRNFVCIRCETSSLTAFD